MISYRNCIRDQLFKISSLSIQFNSKNFYQWFIRREWVYSSSIKVVRSNEKWCFFHIDMNIINFLWNNTHSQFFKFYQEKWKKSSWSCSSMYISLQRMRVMLHVFQFQIYICTFFSFFSLAINSRLDWNIC